MLSYIYIYIYLSNILRPAPKNEDEMMVLIFEYIDRIFSVVRPRKLLYMAIDGVVRYLFEFWSIIFCIPTCDFVALNIHCNIWF